MRFLCFHGRGTNGKVCACALAPKYGQYINSLQIFEAQIGGSLKMKAPRQHLMHYLARVRAALGDVDQFEFVDGDVPTTAAPG
jgi:hypothetical protein